MRFRTANQRSPREVMAATMKSNTIMPTGAYWFLSLTAVPMRPCVLMASLKEPTSVNSGAGRRGCVCLLRFLGHVLVSRCHIMSVATRKRLSLRQPTRHMAAWRPAFQATGFTLPAPQGQGPAWPCTWPSRCLRTGSVLWAAPEMPDPTAFPKSLVGFHHGGHPFSRHEFGR